MLKKYFSYLFSAVLILSFGCSSSEQSTEEETKESEVYVFDEVPVDSTIEIEQPESKTLTKTALYFVIQIGAFTTRDKAEQFANQSRKLIPDNISVTYNHEINLFVVQIDVKFINKNDAVKKRDNLRLNEEFKDAWIITIY